MYASFVDFCTEADAGRNLRQFDLQVFGCYSAAQKSLQSAVAVVVSRVVNCASYSFDQQDMK